MTTEYIEANGLNFTCNVYKNHDGTDGTKTATKNILLLHGFPFSKEWWSPLLEYWDTMTNITAPLHAVACDLRGYSPGASPDDIAEYDYRIFADDAYAIADKSGFDSFHLLGHDHGAGLAWFMAGNDDRGKIKSLGSFSTPHIDQAANAACGDNADQDQVVAATYFNQFALADSATINNSSLFDLFTLFGGGSPTTITDPAQFQKKLWWYHGSVGKYLARPRVVADAEVAAFESKFAVLKSFFVKTVRSAVPLAESPCESPSAGSIGSIEIPTIFVCGTNDPAILCNSSYVTNVPNGLLPNYEHVNFACGHDFFLEGNCNTMDESFKVMEKITSFLMAQSDEVSNDESGSDGSTEESSATRFGSFVVAPAAMTIALISAF